MVYIVCKDIASSADFLGLGRDWLRSDLEATTSSVLMIDAGSPILARWHFVADHVSTALQAIAVADETSDVPLEKIAIDLGVSLRTLQRLLGGATGQSPRWWRRLARARRAAARIADDTADKVVANLSEIALRAGYADQAHLTRELKSWFGSTPTALLHSTSLLAQLRSPGFATLAD